MRSRTPFVLFGLVFGLLCNAVIAFAWTGPTASAPANNTTAPLNVGGTLQVKNGDLGVNNFSAYGNSLLSGLGVGTGRYINFDYTSGGTSGTGAAGYGIWDNNGVLNFKNAGGSWASLQSLIAAGGSQWTTGAAGAIYYNGGNVGVGTPSPGAKLDVSGAIRGNSTILASNNSANFFGLEPEQSESPSHGSLVNSGVWRLLQFEVTSPYTAAFGGALVVGSSNTETANVPANGLYLNGDIKVGNGTYFGDYGTINFPSSDNDNAFLWACTSQNGCGSNNYDLRLYLQDDQDDTEKFSVWGGSCAHGGCSMSTPNSVEQFHVTAAGNGYFRGSVNAGAFLYNSDARLKTNIQPLDLGLLTLMQLKPVSYTWNEKSPLSGENDIGFLAQDVEKIVPTVVHTDAGTGMKSIDYVKLTPILVKAVQDQEVTIETQQAKIDSLDARVTQLETKLSQ